VIVNGYETVFAKSDIHAVQILKITISKNVDSMKSMQVSLALQMRTNYIDYSRYENVSISIIYLFCRSISSKALLQVQ